jgi:hypothetical protein
LVKPPAKAKRRVRRSVSIDKFILIAFTEALQKRGYSRAQARARAKELLAGPGFPGFPVPDAIDA